MDRKDLRQGIENCNMQLLNEAVRSSFCCLKELAKTLNLL
ncbi:hypothetical protein H5410_015683 [Solanum commersonii]|uniref:Uncharacterized protein n=1 Tax=Solanum commersonii TaxID=4109 RepID=A0A9J5ZUT9_SOLCO|nr:hypothetical protein H5410_015683 [Solanum commersonii]